MSALQTGHRCCCRIGLGPESTPQAKKKKKKKKKKKIMVLCCYGVVSYFWDELHECVARSVMLLCGLVNM